MQLTGADARVRETICTGPHWPEVKRLGVAVSGGGDSMALLHLLASCAAGHGVTLEAATVDHGLRPEAAEEAAFVAGVCTRLGVAHETLRWQGWDGTGNLQAEARAARYRLLADWAGRRGLESVALGHTRDDQAETFLMRLGREAGVEGLAAMDAVFSRHGARFWRPALALSRSELRDFLSRHGLGWRDDPSNEDLTYDRVKARKALAVLGELGLDAGRLAGVADNMASAAEALRACAHDAARRIARIDGGDVVFDRAALLSLPHEIGRRLVTAAILWIAGGDYGPRREAVAAMFAAILAARTHTLAGCIVLSDAKTVRFAREFAAVAATVGQSPGVWDRRWVVRGPELPGGELRALGAGIAGCPDWRETGRPRAALMATPAVWQGDTLVAAPLAGRGNGWSAEIDPSTGDFFALVLTH